MARPTPATTVANVVEALTKRPDATYTDIGRSLNLNHETVRDLEMRYQPVLAPFRSIKRDLFTSIYQHGALLAVDEMHAARAAGLLTAGDARNWAVTSAIYAEKALLFAGQPTQIVAGLHEVRVELPALMARLAEVGQRMRALGPTTERDGQETPEGE